jgi:DNA-binding NarL/FixJ family response regulator
MKPKVPDGQKDGEHAALPKRIVIVDDHPLVRQGLTAVIDHQPDLMVSGEAASASEAMTLFTQDRPDLMIVDIMLKETSGVELIKNIHALDGAFPMVVLSMHDEALYAERMLRAGAMGYVMKQEPVERLLEAIRKVLNGQIYVTDKISSTLLRGLFRNSFQPAGAERLGASCLSDRELEVYELIGSGLSTREIARKLKLGLKTIETHRAAIKNKLKLRTAMELVQHATLWVAEARKP